MRTEADKRKEQEDSAEKFMEMFGFRSRIQEIISDDSDSHIPLVLSANSAIFAVSCAILLASSQPGLTATKLLILLSAIFSLVTVSLNIWYLVRIKMRIHKLKQEQDKIFAKTKANLIKTLDLFVAIVESATRQRVELYKAVSTSKEELLKKIADEEKKEKFEGFEFLTEKGMFIFQNVLALAMHETTDNFREALDAPLDESLSTVMLFIDRLSDRLKNWGLVINCILILCALLVITIIG
jgi:hypothetical protein